MNELEEAENIRRSEETRREKRREEESRRQYACAAELSDTSGQKLKRRSDRTPARVTRVRYCSGSARRVGEKRNWGPNNARENEEKRREKKRRDKSA